jgi:hypothetical protein
MIPARLSETEFRERLDAAVAPVLEEANGIYRKQRIRMVFIGASIVLAISLSILAFFPSLMVGFLLILYLGYRAIFGKRNRRKRIKVTEDLRRLILRAILQSTISDRDRGHFSLLTHRYMPPFVFRDSKLFDFKPDRYKSQDLAEIRDPLGRVELAWLSAEEHIDAFERSGREEGQFEGWMFRLLPKRHMGLDAEALRAYHQPEAGRRARLGPDEAWMAFAEKAPLYYQHFFHLTLNYSTCFTLYQSIEAAHACFRPSAEGLSAS